MSSYPIGRSAVASFEFVAGLAKDLRETGLSGGLGEILSPTECRELEDFVDRLHANNSDALYREPHASALVGLAGRDPRLDELLEKIVSSVQVRGVLRDVLGDGYKVWQILSRVSEAGDHGLTLHQDRPGETGLMFILSNQESGEGVTAFLPASLLLPRWASKVAWGPVLIARRFLRPIAGKVGDSVL